MVGRQNPPEVFQGIGDRIRRLLPYLPAFTLAVTCLVFVVRLDAATSSMARELAGLREEVASIRREFGSVRQDLTSQLVTVQTSLDRRVSQECLLRPDYRADHDRIQARLLRLEQRARGGRQ